MTIINRHILSAVVFTASAYSAIGQADERVAYLPANAIARTADDISIGFRESAVPGVVELELPRGTWRVDILDTRGELDHTLEGRDLNILDLSTLAKGTWTMRAHTPEGYSVRRFIVLQRGTVAWAVPPAPRKR
jgi:hypothetical protein